MKLNGFKPAELLIQKGKKIRYASSKDAKKVEKI